MSGGGGKSGKAGRSVTPDEAELWNQLTRSLDKVKAKPRVAGRSADLLPAAPPAKAVHAAAAPAKTAPAIPPRPQQGGPKPQRLSPLPELDRRTARRVASGRVAIEARLDLHGARQRDARARLRSFLLDAQASGLKTVLVITGKGGDAGSADPLAGALGEPQRGVLRRSVPHWLDEPDLRAIVLSYAAAGARHGGDGALYVQLRTAARNR